MADSKLLRWVFVVVLASNGVTICHSQSETTSETRAVDSTTSLMREEIDNNLYKNREADATLMKLLVDKKDGLGRSEAFDMLISRDDNSQHVDLPSFPEDAEDFKLDVPMVPDAQAEFLQVSGSAVQRDSSRGRYTAEPVGTAAVIMVVVTCSIVCLAYTSLVVWRRIYLKRNGLKHELLRNEENFAETRIEL